MPYHQFSGFPERQTQHLQKLGPPVCLENANRIFDFGNSNGEKILIGRRRILLPVQSLLLPTT